MILSACNYGNNSVSLSCNFDLVAKTASFSVKTYTEKTGYQNTEFSDFAAAVDAYNTQQVMLGQIQLYNSMKNAFSALPDSVNKSSLTAPAFYSHVLNREQETSEFRDLISTMDQHKLTFVDEEFLEFFSYIKENHSRESGKPSLSAQLKSAESRGSDGSPGSVTKTVTTEPSR